MKSMENELPIGSCSVRARLLPGVLLLLCPLPFRTQTSAGTLRVQVTGQSGSAEARAYQNSPPPTLDHALIRLSIPFAAPTDPEPSAGYAIQVQDHAPVFMDVLTNLCSSSEILSGGRTKSTQPEA